jgi:hypothetical protein
MRVIFEGEKKACRIKYKYKSNSKKKNTHTHTNKNRRYKPTYFSKILIILKIQKKEQLN